MPASHLTNPLGPPGGVYPPKEAQRPVQLAAEPRVRPRRRLDLPAVLAQGWLPAVLAVTLVAVTVAVYYPVHQLPFLSLNDAEYVTQNVRIQQLNWTTVSWAFSTFHAANWHPLTWLSHAVDYRLFGLDAGRHHAINLLLHALNAGLLFWVLWRATARAGCSFMVAALFALHPINVESVAWVAERKNLLSMFFLLLALGAYRWYASKPGIGRYNLVVTLFVLGLLSKPQVVTLPFLLLLWDYWPLERFAGGKHLASCKIATASEIPARSFSWLILEKLPLLAFSAAAALLTVQAQRAGGAMGGALRSYSLVLRIENAIISYARYLGKAIWPAHLAFFYPHPAVFRGEQLAQALVLLLLITAVVVAWRDRRYLTVGWLWFLGTLVPMIGLLQVGGQAMADRYAYLPYVGLFLAVCWAVADWAEQYHVPELGLAAASVAVLVILLHATHRQLSYWSDEVSLWSHTVQVSSNNPAAKNMLGEALQREGREDDAMLQFRAASAGDPFLPYPHYHIGIYAEHHGDLRGAIAQFQKVITLTRSDTGLLAALRADTFARMSYDYEAVGDSAAADDCVKSALNEQHRERSFELKTFP